MEKNDRDKLTRTQIDIIKSKYKQRDKTKQTEDTINRIDIHRDIQKMLSEGKGKVDILTTLLNNYPNSNLSKYFEQWIDYHIEKKDFKIKDKDDGETR